MDSIRLHRVNFFNPRPKAIKSMSYDKEKQSLAVSRSDSSIEIWDLKGNPYLEKVCPGLPSISIEAIAWCSGRLFSVGLYGHISEHDLCNLFPKNQLVVTSGASLWCIKEHRGKYLAVGNEDGQVVIYQLSSEELNYEKKFDRQEGSVLCLAWHPDGEIIVTGSLDAIRVWNVSTGRVINRILMTRSTKNTPTVVWCIAILRDMTIISGDSCSKVSFWDGNTGTLLTSPGTKERMDILALCVNDEEDKVFTCGVDPTIVSYCKDNESGMWIKSQQRHAHSHDVRALLLTDKFLVSGGDDSNLVFTKYPPKTTVKLFPFCQKSYTMTSSDPPCVLLQYHDCVEVWSLPQTQGLAGNKGPINLIRVKTKEDERIMTSAISPDGKYLAYSSQSKLRLFRIYLGASSVNPEVEKIALPSDLESAANLLLFTSNPCSLIVCSNNKYSIIMCDNLQPSFQASIDEDPDSLDETHLMELSCNDHYLACGSHNGHVTVYDLKNLKVFRKLPHYKCQPTALMFDSYTENLVVAYSDRKVIEYNLVEGAYTKWSQHPALLDFQNSYHTINSICFKSNLMFLQDETKLYIFDRLKDEIQDNKRRKRSGSTFDSVKKDLFKAVDKYEHISKIHICKEDLVVVHHSSNKILDFLPPPIYKKRFGT